MNSQEPENPKWVGASKWIQTLELTIAPKKEWPQKTRKQNIATTQSRKIIDLLVGLFRWAVFDNGGVPENSPLALMGRFASLMGRFFPTLMGRVPECLNGPFSLFKSHGKQPIKKRGIKRFLITIPKFLYVYVFLSLLKIQQAEKEIEGSKKFWGRGLIICFPRASVSPPSIAALWKIIHGHLNLTLQKHRKN